MFPFGTKGLRQWDLDIDEFFEGLIETKFQYIAPILDGLQ
jgi:hypothetical protein